MNIRRIVSSLLVLSLLSLAACGLVPEDDTPPRPASPAAAPNAPGTPPTVTGVAPVAPPAPVAPVPPPMPAAPVAAPAPPQLLGLYELVWRQRSPSAEREEMPASLISRVPGCIWARWGWDFAADGGVTVSNEMLCAAPPELGAGQGVCRAEFVTNVQWQAGGFALPAPVRTESRFVHYRRQGQSATFDTSTIRCSVALDTMQATLTEIVPGPGASRPQEVTLLLADGERMRLRAVEGDPNHATRILDAIE